MTITIETAKTRLDSIINKARIDLYKPIQIAEVLRRSRLEQGIDPLNLDSYRTQSVHWRNAVTSRLTGKTSTSSAQYQHHVWEDSAMPPEILSVLDKENKKTDGAVERYIYLRYGERQGTVSEIISVIKTATPKTFELSTLLELFVTHPGIRRSIDKAYEIVAYSLFETIVVESGITVKVSTTERNLEFLEEFSDLTKVLVGLDSTCLEWEQAAHIYRVGVTNAADRGLDMWANFGPAVQVKHLTLNESLASSIVEQVESDHVVIVCRDADAEVIKVVMRQIGWGRRVRGIVKESDLINWYERCLRGKCSAKLGEPLLTRLTEEFKAEFPQTKTLSDFLEERGYQKLEPPDQWKT